MRRLRITKILMLFTLLFQLIIIGSVVFYVITNIKSRHEAMHSPLPLGLRFVDTGSRVELTRSDSTSYFDASILVGRVGIGRRNLMIQVLGDRGDETWLILGEDAITPLVQQSDEKLRQAAWNQLGEVWKDIKWVQIN